VSDVGRGTQLIRGNRDGMQLENSVLAVGKLKTFYCALQDRNGLFHYLQNRILHDKIGQRSKNHFLVQDLAAVVCIKSCPSYQ